MTCVNICKKRKGGLKTLGRETAELVNLSILRGICNFLMWYFPLTCMVYTPYRKPLKLKFVSLSGMQCLFYDI